MTWMAVRASLVCLGSEPGLEEDTVMARSLLRSQRSS